MMGKSENQRETKKRKILSCIKHNTAISRAEISSTLNISKPTVSSLVDELIQEDWVYERGNGKASSQGGRKPIKLYFNQSAAYIIGTDIGGTKVKTIISDLDGRIVSSSSFNTASHLKTGIIKQISKEVEKMLELTGIEDSKILGMGVGVPGITDTSCGMVVEAPSLDWIRYPFLSVAKKYFSFPIYIDNDVNVAALGEKWLGSAKDKENVLFIAVGTGIGSGLIIQNKLYRGFSSAAGEIGYMVTDKEHLKHGFQPIFHRYGYLESVAGGKAIGDNFTNKLLSHQEHTHYIAAKKGQISGKDVFKLAKLGDPLAIEVVEESIEHLAFGIVNAASLLNPEVIILGGGVMQSGDYILPKLQKIINRYLPSSINLKTANLEEDAGVLGSVALFLSEHESVIQSI